MQKNVSGQKLVVYVFDSTTNLPRTGDAVNLTAYVNKDWGGVNQLGDTSATEVDATNCKGFYLFDLTQAETNADCLLFSCKSSTSNIVVLAMPATVFTTPPGFSALTVAAIQAGLSTYAGGDTSGTTTLLTRLPGTVQPQTGDSFAMIGTAGAGLTALGDARLANLDATVSTRLPTSSYTAPLTAATTRAAVGLASANLDTQLATIDTDVLTRLPTTSYTAPLTASGTRAAVGLGSANLDAQFAAISGGVTVTAVSAGAITGASFVAPSDGTGQASNVLEMILWLYERFYGKVVKDSGADTIRTFHADGSTVRTTQTFSTTVTTDTVNAAS